MQLRRILGLSVAAVLIAACGSRVAPPETSAPQPPPAQDSATATVSDPEPASAAPATPAPRRQTASGSDAATTTRAARPQQRLAAVSLPPIHPTESPQIAWDPARLTRQIVAAERTVRSDTATEAQLSASGHLLQLAYRRLGNQDDLARQVVPSLPRWLRPFARVNLRAQRELDSLSGTAPPKTLPSWRIVKPAPRRELMGYYRKAERVFGVPWYYLAAINLVETRMGRIRGTSTAGAQGPMQFIPPTWAIYGRGDINDNHDAIMAAGRYLDARGAPGDMPAAVYAYNNDTRYVRAVTAYAEAMWRDARAFRGYYHWQVYYRQKGGPVLLPVGYDGR